jgi:hypothetical protein
MDSVHLPVFKLIRFGDRISFRPEANNKIETCTAVTGN